MAAHALKLALSLTILFWLGGCKPQFGSVVITNGTNRTISEIVVEFPALNSGFNNQAGVARARALEPGQSASQHTKGLSTGNVIVSWTEPDGSAASANATLGHQALSSVEVVIEEDGSITIKK